MGCVVHILNTMLDAGAAVLHENTQSAASVSRDRHPEINLASHSNILLFKGEASGNKPLNREAPRL